MFDYGGFTKIQSNKDYFNLKNLRIIYSEEDLMPSIKFFLSKKFEYDPNLSKFTEFDDFRSKNIMTKTIYDE